MRRIMEQKFLIRDFLLKRNISAQGFTWSKIWMGNEYNERGEKQLRDYLDHFQR